MKVIHVVMFSCFSAVCVKASAMLEVSGFVGGDVSIHCSGSWKTNKSSEHYNLYFCKGVCATENILVQTERKGLAATQRGRYSMEVENGDGAFNVTIKRLRRADAGTYHCGVEKTFNVLHQEVNLKVTEAPSLPLRPPPSTATLQTEAESQPQGNSAANPKLSPSVASLPAAEDKTERPAAASLKDTTVVIIVSVSLALLVCAIIPLIFYGHCRSNAEGQSKEESEYCEENAGVGATQTAVRLQPLEADDDQESRSHDASQYAAVYQALDPKTLD